VISLRVGQGDLFPWPRFYLISANLLSAGPFINVPQPLDGAVDLFPRRTIFIKVLFQLTGTENEMLSQPKSCQFTQPQGQGLPPA